MPEETKQPEVVSNNVGTEDPDVFTRDYVVKLREENARYRTQRNEVSEELDALKKKAEEYDSMLTKQAEEQGKYKELYEASKQDAERLKNLEDKVKKYEDTFTAQLDAVVKTMSESQKELYEGLPEMAVEDKLNWAKKLLSQSGSVESPAVERASSGSVFSNSEWEKIINDKEKLIDLSINNRPLYEKIIAYKNKIFKE